MIRSSRVGIAPCCITSPTARRCGSFVAPVARSPTWGEFRVDDDEPFIFDDAPATNNGPPRQVIVFRLGPVGDVVHDPQDDLVAPQVDAGSATAAPVGVQVNGSTMTAVPVEAHNTETYTINPSAEPSEGERREQALVVRYRAWLRAQGKTVVRHRYLVESGAKPLYSDLFDVTRNLLVEAKSSVTRSSVRMAIGQLADYLRFETSDPSQAVFLRADPVPTSSNCCNTAPLGSSTHSGTPFTRSSPGRSQASPVRV